MRVWLVGVGLLLALVLSLAGCSQGEGRFATPAAGASGSQGSGSPRPDSGGSSAQSTGLRCESGIVTLQPTPGASPAPSVRAAMAPYVSGAQSIDILNKFGDTAHVLVRRTNGVARVEVTLLRLSGGWVRTEVRRCR